MKNSRRLFKSPWQYKEGFVFSLIIVLLGLGIGVFTNGSQFLFPSFPSNLSLIVSYTLLIFFLYWFEKESVFIQWISGIPAAITSIILITLVSTVLGFIPQIEYAPKEKDLYYLLGLSHLTTSWLFAFSYFYFTTSLGFATAKIMFPIKKKKLGTILSHLGLYIILVGAVAGSGDIQRKYFVLEPNVPTNIVRDYDSDAPMARLPFKLELLNFDIKEYSPKIVLITNEGETKIFEQNKKKSFYADDTTVVTFKDWDIEIIKFYKYSIPGDSLSSFFVDTMMRGSSPSALIKVSETASKKIVTQMWITCGSYAMSRMNAPISKDYSFAMLSPEAKEFSSDVVARLPNGEEERFTLKVNEPHTIKGWVLYQTGYDDRKGKWSDYSTIEAGYDPWLWFVYIGMYILMAGAVYIFWLGRKFSKNKDDKIEIE